MNVNQLNISLIPLRYCKSKSQSKSAFPNDHVVCKLSPSNRSARKLVNTIWNDNSYNCNLSSNTCKTKSCKSKKLDVEFKGSVKRCYSSQTNVDNGFIKFFRPQFEDFKACHPENVDCSLKIRKHVHVSKKLRKAITICHTILKNCCKKCYFPLLNLHCPLNQLNILSERKSFSEIRDENKTLIEMHSSTDKVFLFIRSVSKRILPTKEVWGTPKNENNFYKNLRVVLESRVFDSIFIDECIANVSVKDIPWLSVQQSQSLLQKFVWWYIVNIIFVILRKYFYVTEHGRFRNRLLFYRHELWTKIVTNGIDILLLSQIWSSVPNSLPNKSFMEFTCRFFPKDSGIRPIMKLTNQPLRKSNQGLTDQIILKIFKKICKKCPALLGCGIRGKNEIYLHWRKFVKDLQSFQLNNIQLFYAKVDIQKCFDTIPIEKLLDVITGILKMNDIKTLKIKTLTGWNLTVNNYAESIIHSLENSLKNVSIIANNQNFIKLQGVPQGWCLSAILCNLFYGHMERLYFKEYIQDDDTVKSNRHLPRLLLRYVDDFLFVTTCKEDGMVFIKKMHKGFPDYGCFVNPQKSFANFSVEKADFLYCKSLTTVNQHETFQWYGFLFPSYCPSSSMINGSNQWGVGIDLSLYQRLESMRDSVSVDRTSSFDNTLASISRGLKFRAAKICFNNAVNSRVQILSNIYHLSVLAAMKWLTHDIAHQYHTKRCSGEAVMGIQTLVDHMLENHFSIQMNGKKFPNRIEAMWICYHAFVTSLWRQKVAYKEIIFGLKRLIRNIKNKLAHSEKWSSKKYLFYKAISKFPPGLKRLSIR